MFKQKWKFILLTWLSWSWKTTLSKHIYNYYTNKIYDIILIDWDDIRKTICKDLWFSKKDRNSNIERIWEVSKMFIDVWFNVVCSVIAPYEKHRIYFKRMFWKNYFQIYLNSSLKDCNNRDVKWLYKKSNEWKIKNFTWILDNYEIPKNNNLVIDIEKFTIWESMYMITNELNIR